MTSLRASGQLLAVDTDTRELDYLLLPYGEPGRTSVGVVTASAGRLTLPADPAALQLNVEHDRTQPVGVGVQLTDTPTGLRARFRAYRTPRGDELLAEAGERARPGISVEIDDPVIRAGQLLGGTLAGAAAVVRPAFPSALVAADTDPVDPLLPFTADPPTDDPPTDDPVPAPADPDPAPEPMPEPTPEVDPMPDADTDTAAAPPGLTASAPARTPTRRGPADLIAATVRGELTTMGLEAALSDLVVTKVGPPAVDNTAAFETTWLGQLWKAQTLQRKLIELFGVLPATTLTYTGFTLTDGLHVADYAGNKTDIPTNVPVLTGATYSLSRMAGGVDVDRAFFDFGNADVIAAVVAWAIRDFQAKTEAKVETAALAAATSAGAAAAPLDTVANAIAKLLGAGANLDGLFYSTDVFAALFKVSPAFAFLQGSVDLGAGTLDLGGVSGGVLPSLPAKTVLAVDKRAGEYREKVLEVNALDIARAGVDEAVYGYYGFLVVDAAGIVKGTTT